MKNIDRGDYNSQNEKGKKQRYIVGRAWLCY